MSVEMIDLPSLPQRDPDGHKGTFGTVGVIGGQVSERIMLGSPALAALGALRSGCGLAMIAAPAPIMQSVLSIAFEATGIAVPTEPDGSWHASTFAELIDNHLSSASVLALGPGFGDGEPQRQVVLRLIAREDHPLVIDADALNVLARTETMQKDFHASAILTPHPGEFARIARTLGVEPTPTSDEDRIRAAMDLAMRLGVVVVLKGARTVITDGIRLFVNQTGNAGLATGGSGDVLTGICAGFVAQFRGKLDLMECASLAAHVHGTASDIVVGERGTARMLAREIVEAIPRAIARITSGNA